MRLNLQFLNFNTSCSTQGYFIKKIKIKMKLTYPNYHKIYTDIINSKYPEKKEICKHFMEKKELSALDVIKINELIFSGIGFSCEKVNHKFRSYDGSSILEILNYQKKYNLNNTETALHFKLSRNTIAKWKVHFLL